MENVSSQKEQVSKSLIAKALEGIKTKYGTGKDDGITPLSYHNPTHTNAVVQASLKLGNEALKNGKIGSNDLLLIEIAAAFHDIEQGFGSGENEEKSSLTAEKAMRKSEVFDDEEIEKVKRAIKGTKTTLSNGQLIQTGGEDYLSKILADADLSILGSPFETYWQAALALLKEMKRKEPTEENLLKFRQLQENILTSHHFFTGEAKELFPHQQENLRQIPETLLIPAPLSMI